MATPEDTEATIAELIEQVGVGGILAACERHCERERDRHDPSQGGEARARHLAARQDAETLRDARMRLRN
jgi:hypothetical protein